MGKMIRGTICEQVRQSGYFSLMADETKDVRKQEQLSVVVRYVDKEGIVNERFLTFVQATSLNAESLSGYLLKVLEDNELDPACIVSQGYDGASVMSGNCSGVQQQIKERSPCTIYIHCCAHILNLVLVDCSKKVQFAHDFFYLKLCMYSWLHQKHTRCLYQHRKDYIRISPLMNHKSLVTHAGLAGMVLSVPFVILLIHFYQH